MGMIEEEGDRGSNRVLVDLPERLRKAKAALRDYEDLMDDLKTLLFQRVILKDGVVLDQISERLDAWEKENGR
jgi:hypothetical protein